MYMLVSNMDRLAEICKVPTNFLKLVLDAESETEYANCSEIEIERKRLDHIRFLDKVVQLQDWSDDAFCYFETQSFAHRSGMPVELVRIVLNAERGEIIEEHVKWPIRDERISFLAKIFLIITSNH